MLVSDMLTQKEDGEKPKKTTMNNINHLNKTWGEVPKFHEKLCTQAKWLNKKVRAERTKKKMEKEEQN